MDFILKRRALNFFGVASFVVGLISLNLGIEEILNSNELNKTSIGFILFFLAMAFPAIQSILYKRKYGSVVLKANSKTLEYTNGQTDEQKIVEWEDVLGIINIKSSRNTRGCFGIIVDKKIQECGKKVYFDPKQNRLEDDEVNNNALFVEVNIGNANISSVKIQEKLMNYKAESEKLKSEN